MITTGAAGFCDVSFNDDDDSSDACSRHRTLRTADRYQPTIVARMAGRDLNQGRKSTKTETDAKRVRWWRLKSKEWETSRKACKMRLLAKDDKKCKQGETPEVFFFFAAAQSERADCVLNSR